MSDLIPVRLHWKKDELSVCACMCVSVCVCVCVCVCVVEEHSVLYPRCKGKLTRIYLELDYFHVDEY